MEPNVLSGGTVKSLSDLVQVLVMDGGFFGIVFWVIAIVLAWQVLKVVFVALGWFLVKLKKDLI